MHDSIWVNSEQLRYWFNNFYLIPSDLIFAKAMWETKRKERSSFDNNRPIFELSEGAHRKKCSSFADGNELEMTKKTIQLRTEEKREMHTHDSGHSF